MTRHPHPHHRQRQKKIVKALEEEVGLPLASAELPALPPPHLPVYEWTLQLLSVPEDTAMRFAEALRGHLGVHTGEQLLRKDFAADVEPALAGVWLQGHRKAIKVILKQQQQQQGKKK